MKTHPKFQSYFSFKVFTRFLISILLTLALVLAAGSSPAQASETGTFLSVEGKVLIRNPSGVSRPATVGAEAAEGEAVVTDKDSKATLKFFDGSQIDIKPETDLQLDKLEKPSDMDKILEFKLLVGKLFASVKKLGSSKSAFEIEAGGVVCGVRGTEFSMGYDGAQKLDLHVFEGSVYAKAGGKTSVFNAGDIGHFKNGKPDHPAPPKESAGTNEGDQTAGGFGVLNHDPSLMDMKAQFSRSLLINHDNAFTDPAVGGLKTIPLTATVPSNEAGP
jgi:hypothetical protein